MIPPALLLRAQVVKWKKFNSFSSPQGQQQPEILYRAFPMFLSGGNCWREGQVGASQNQWSPVLYTHSYHGRDSFWHYPSSSEIRHPPCFSVLLSAWQGSWNSYTAAEKPWLNTAWVSQLAGGFHWLNLTSRLLVLLFQLQGNAFQSIPLLSAGAVAFSCVLQKDFFLNFFFFLIKSFKSSVCDVILCEAAKNPTPQGTPASWGLLGQKCWKQQSGLWWGWALWLEHAGSVCKLHSA